MCLKESRLLKWGGFVVLDLHSPPLSPLQHVYELFLPILTKMISGHVKDTFLNYWSSCYWYITTLELLLHCYSHSWHWIYFQGPKQYLLHVSKPEEMVNTGGKNVVSESHALSVQARLVRCEFYQPRGFASVYYVFPRSPGFYITLLQRSTQQASFNHRKCISQGSLRKMQMLGVNRRS